jgi:hypothetical protein
LESRIIWWLTLLQRLAAAIVKSCWDLVLENLAVRHKLLVLTQNTSFGWKIHAHAAIRDSKDPAQWDWNCCFLITFL